MFTNSYKLEPPQTHEIYTVSQLNRATRELLEDHFPSIWIEGEISNLARPSSGHIYFSLKDVSAQVRCAMFRGRNQLLDFKPEDGQHVLARARVSLYEGRGEYQLIIEYLEETGDGALRRAFELLKQKLDKEGLFAEVHKKVIPTIPHCIGVVTSPTGAAIRDILTVLKRRFPSIPVIIYPTQVQGEKAAEQIVRAIESANQRNECDVLIVSRGGGSIEDLWPFNEEKVARAMFASRIPIVSGVGHEIDFTIADFIADKRAPTPSAAAELASPNQEEWLATLTRIEQQLHAIYLKLIDHKRQTILWLSKRLRHPGQLLREQMQKLDNFEQTLIRALSSSMHQWNAKVETTHLRLQQYNPRHTIQTQFAEHQALEKRLCHATQKILQQAKQQLAHRMHSLDAVSPLATLNRGYAILNEKKTGNIIRKARDVKIGDELVARLSEGHLECVVGNVEGV